MHGGLHNPSPLPDRENGQRVEVRVSYTAPVAYTIEKDSSEMRDRIAFRIAPGNMGMRPMRLLPTLP